MKSMTMHAFDPAYLAEQLLLLEPFAIRCTDNGAIYMFVEIAPGWLMFKSDFSNSVAVNANGNWYAAKDHYSRTVGVLINSGVGVRLVDTKEFACLSAGPAEYAKYKLLREEKSK